MKKHKSRKRHRKAASNPKHYSRKRRSHKRARRNPASPKYTKAGRVRVSRLKRYTRKVNGVNKSFVAHFKRNPLGAVGNFIRIPSGQELMAVGVGALALPAVSMLFKRYVPLPAVMKESWGGIATDLLIGSAASMAARRFVSPQAGDVVFVLTLARGVQAVTKQVVGAERATAWLGLGMEGEGDESLGYYEAGQLGYADAPGFGDETMAAESNELPTMV